MSVVILQTHLSASCQSSIEKVWYKTGVEGCFLANDENGDIVGQLLACDEKLGAVAQFCSETDCTSGCLKPKVLSHQVSFYSACYSNPVWTRSSYLC